MKVIECTRCGSSELLQGDGFVQCIYCQTRFAPEVGDAPPKGSTIGLTSDIQRLLGKCRSDPVNRQRYASLILDIDPTNAEALQYLR